MDAYLPRLGVAEIWFGLGVVCKTPKYSNQFLIGEIFLG
jgi:hypothetical protein